MRKKKKATTMLPWLPHEIILFHILSKLPVRCLLKFTCVSKLWYNTIHHDPNFIASHFTHAKSNPSLVALASQLNAKFISFGGHHHPPNINNSVSHLVLQFESICVVGSCNGLTCNRLISSSAFQIINPCTRELLTFPQPKLSTATRSFCTMKHGFGFDPLKYEYKVIQMCLKHRSEYYECWVYTLGGGGGGTTNLWRNITATCNYLPSCFPFNLAPICIRGVLFWWTCSNIYGREWILSFDLRHEKFQLIPCPQVPEAGYICRTMFELEEGRPCLVYRQDGVQTLLYMLNEEDHHHLNVMHEDSSSSSSSSGSWIRLGYYIPLPKRPYLLQPVAFHNQIYLQNGDSKLYNVNREGIQYKLSDVRSWDSSGHWVIVILVNHVENLLSLKTFVPPPSSGEAEVRYVSSRDAIHEILTTATTVQQVPLVVVQILNNNNGNCGGKGSAYDFSIMVFSLVGSQGNEEEDSLCCSSMFIN